jgi:hypothetical protein
MRFTMLNPKATATAVMDEPSPAKNDDWKDSYKYGYDEVEAPWSFRYAQIGIGIATYWVASRFVLPILFLPILTSLGEMESTTAVVTVAVLYLFIYCVAALCGGMAAGMWARNWVPQGIGVALGVTIIPLVWILIFIPESWIFWAVGMVLTSLFTVFGAFLGHLLVKPTRVPRS